jgi:Kef-type K+ transport system membrane component KefB
MAIDPRAVVDEPESLVLFVLMILLVRGGVVLVATLTQRVDGAPAFDRRESVAMALYASTGLPVIVAVTSVAVAAGQMSTINASVLVAGGALTVLVCPFVAERVRRPRVTRIG